MLERHTELVVSVIQVIELVGVGIIAAGAAITTALYLLRLARRADSLQAFHAFRSSFGRAILLGLEFLVAADIIGTVAVEPSFSNLGVLAIIVAIRTFLSFTLEMEVTGRWPWQHAEHASPARPAA